jgi:cobalt-zinc-cadmium efflux system outer membrane protein
LQLPNGATLEDGLTEEEAVLIALWNNALFQEILVERDLAASDLVQAGLLPNPEFVYFFPASDKPFKYAFDLPLEAFWLRPIRMEAAERESQRVCQRLSQAALDLIRDTRQAYADVLIASGRLQVAAEAVRLRQRIANAAKARLDAGDASPQEFSVTEVDVQLAEQEQTRLRYDVELAQERLRNLMGIADHRDPLVLTGGPPPIAGSLDADLLAQQAISSRPDMLAANVAVAAADARVHLAEVGWIRVLGILDATSGTRTGHELSPAVRATLPLFNCNEGAILRANAELQRALRQQQSLHDRIMLEVHQAHQRYEQAQAELEVLDEQVMPEIEIAIKQIETAFREGDVSYLVVLQASRQLLDSRTRRHQLHGELRRAWAELERSVAQHIVAETPPEAVEGIPVEEIPMGMEAAEDEEPPTCTIEAPSPG